MKETNEVKGLYERTGQWSYLLDSSVTPVILEDAKVAEVIKKI